MDSRTPSISVAADAVIVRTKTKNFIYIDDNKYPPSTTRVCPVM